MIREVKMGAGMEWRLPSRRINNHTNSFVDPKGILRDHVECIQVVYQVSITSYLENKLIRSMKI